jgi:uncharacterized protein (DUF58 family)
VKEIHYRVAAPVRGHFPGQHRSGGGSGGFEFRGHASLLDAPDPRRLDLHASLRDPFGQWRVRLHAQRMAMPVVVVADLSASMAFGGQRRKPEVLADLVDSLSWSAWRAGDSFGFIGCDAGIGDRWLTPPTRQRGAGHLLAQALRQWQPQGDGAQSSDGLLQAHRLLGRRRALVFLVSDFHFPLPQLQALLASLAVHEVLPLVLWDAQEFSMDATAGLAPLADPESGRRQLLWWRPALRARWQQALAERRAALLAAFEAQRLRPLFIEDGFDADAVTRHFHG